MRPFGCFKIGWRRCAFAFLLLWAAPLCAPRAADTPGVPVSVAKVLRQDVPIWLRGLGTVQAFQSVLVRARVDGALMQMPVSEGQEVKQGDLIAVIDPRPYQAALDAAMAKKAQDEADLSNAQNDLARYNSLAKESFASRQQVDTQQALVRHMFAAMAADDAQIETARLSLSYCYITAPIGGRVGLRNVDPGNLVRATDGTALITITEMHPISVVFTLPAEELFRINVRMGEAKLKVVAYSQDDRTELDSGELLTPDNAIDSSTGTIKLKATFPNQRNTLWPGQFVNARLLLDTDHDVLTVPSAAVQHGADGLYVYVVKPDSTIARLPVTMARDDGKSAILTGGVQAGQDIVTSGYSRLQDGTRVSVVAPQNGANSAEAVAPKAGG